MGTERKPPILNGVYSPVRLLGSGNFGEVWLMKDLLLEEEVAVKLLAPHVEFNEALLEVQLMNRLRAHQRVVTVRHKELGGPLPFIVMDYERGGSVGDRLEAGTVSMVDALRWTREGLDGLAHAHDEGVLHRDLKPNNFLLDAEDRALVSDFGIAEDTIRGLIAAPQIYVPHAAPELLSGSQSTRASDIFAMGCTQYRLLTGDRPFADRAAIEAGVFTAVHRLNPQVPLAVSRIIEKALSPDPDDRYDDAREMLGALTACAVTCSWSKADQEGDLETWFLDGHDGEYILRLQEKRGGAFVVRVTRDKGSGHRKWFEERFDRRAAAERVRRKILLALAQS
jgi:serine/threonine-protein kinase